jgi:type IV pilus assembly protein PilC
VSTFIKLSQFYKNFSDLYSAGIDVASTVEALQKKADGDIGQALNLTVLNLRKGRTLHQSFKVTQLVPTQDIPIVKAAEDSGRIVDIFNSLSDKYKSIDIAVKQLRGSLIKPYFTFAVALMFTGIADLFSEKISLASYLRNSLGILLLISVAIYLVYDYWIQSYFNVQKARTLYGVFNSLPLLKGLSDRMALEKFATSLSFMLESGIDFFESLKQSAQCSANPKIYKAAERLVPKLQSGANIQTVFQTESVFPPDLTSAISLGSQSGKLPEFLRRYSTELKNKNDATINTIVRFFPIVVYWVIIAQVIFSITKFYSGHLDQILKIAP